MNRHILTFVLLLSSNAFAVGVVSDTKITKLYCGFYNGANMCSIYLDRLIVNTPTCHTLSSSRFQIPTDTDTGKAILSLALTAFNTQKLVDAHGKGISSVWSDTEDMNVLVNQY